MNYDKHADVPIPDNSYGVTMGELVYDPTKGHDVWTENGRLLFNPNNYSTKEAAAKALHVALIGWAVDHFGYTEELAKSEIALFSPDQEYMGYKQWAVVWESGPFEWGIHLSAYLRGPWGYTEPYYSFDVTFTD